MHESSFFHLIFSRGHATLHPTVSVGRAVRPSDRPVTFLNSERFLPYSSCPTIHDWIAMYPALFSTTALLNDHYSFCINAPAQNPLEQAARGSRVYGLVLGPFNYILSTAT